MHCVHFRAGIIFRTVLPTNLFITYNWILLRIFWCKMFRSSTGSLSNWEQTRFVRPLVSHLTLRSAMFLWRSSTWLSRSILCSSLTPVESSGRRDEWMDPTPNLATRMYSRSHQKLKSGGEAQGRVKGAISDRPLTRWQANRRTDCPTEILVVKLIPSVIYSISTSTTTRIENIDGVAMTYNQL